MRLKFPKVSPAKQSAPHCSTTASGWYRFFTSLMILPQCLTLGDFILNITKFFVKLKNSHGYHSLVSLNDHSRNGEKGNGSLPSCPRAPYGIKMQTTGNLSRINDMHNSLSPLGRLYRKLRFDPCTCVICLFLDMAAYMSVNLHQSVAVQVKH